MENTQKCLLKKSEKKKKYIYKRKICYNKEDEDYGATEDVMCDKNPYILAMEKNSFLMQFEKNRSEEIFNSTIGQSCNPIWHKERLNRITASNFGTICKMRANTNTKNLVKSLLTPNYHQSAIKSIKYGIEKEEIAKKLFTERTNLQVQQSGLFVDTEYLFMGASPDGIVEDGALLEIKCPFSARDDKIVDAIKSKRILCCQLLTVNNCTTITLKRNHNYYYQIQGALHIAKRKYCYFVLYTKIDLHIEKIEYDDVFWKNNMTQNLIQFYLNVLLPEIVDSRRARNMPIRNIKLGDLK